MTLMNKNEEIKDEISRLSQELISKYSNGMNSFIDEKIKQACLYWCVDIENHRELKERCVLEIHENGENIVKIDSYPVLMYKFVNEFEQINITDIGNNKVSVETKIKISDVLAPKDYGIEDRYN